MKVSKRIAKAIAIGFLVFLGIASTGIIVLLSQQQKLVNIAVAEVNKQLAGELIIKKSKLSLLKNFPYISFALHDAQLYRDKTGTGKPLFEIDRLYVGFDITDILNERYHIRRLFLQGGNIDLALTENGDLDLMKVLNLKNDSTATPAEGKQHDMAVQLNRMDIRNLAITYTDNAGGTRLSDSIQHLTVSFKTDSTHLQIVLNGDMKVDITSKTDTVLFRHKRVALDIHADYDKQKRFLELSSGGIGLNDGSFTLEGVASLGTEKYVDFRLKGDKPDIGLITAFVPADAKNILKPFKYDGRIYFDGIIKGPFSRTMAPLIEISFGCEDAWFLNAGTEKKVDELEFTGFYTNGVERSLRTSEVRITKVHARPEKGIFQGNFIVRDFTDPQIVTQVNADLELQFLADFLGLQRLKHLTGRIKLNMDFNELKDLDAPDALLIDLKKGIQSELIVENLSFQIPGHPHRIENLNLHAEMEQGRISLDSFFVRFGDSDLRLRGSLSDLPAFLHNHGKPVTLTLEAASNRIVLKELFAYDTALAKKVREEIKDFQVATILETSVDELLHPKPLPKGRFEVKGLKASFMRYPHVFGNIGAQLMINDTALVLRNLGGEIDYSDFLFSGRILNYKLWFDDIKQGKTQWGFDFKSKRLAIPDLLSNVGLQYLPEAYRSEVVSDVWLRAKADMFYDTAFRFAAVTVHNASGKMKNHNFRMKDIRGRMIYGVDRILKIDTLRGRIGRTDLDVSLRLFTGKDKRIRKQTNYFYFKSKFLDVDEITRYSARFTDDSPSSGEKLAEASAPEESSHARAFNFFTVPFSDFNVDIDIDRIKYNRLWLGNVAAKLRMQEDHFIHMDTLAAEIAGGVVAMKGYLDGRNPQKIYFNSKLDVKDVDLENLMIKFDHLGQDLIINKNIKGRLSGTIRSHVRIHPDFVPLMNDSKAQLDVSLYDGSLVNFAPMQALSGYFKDKNLNLVRFDTLKNIFTLTNGELNIPAMNINSSLGFMEISGKQSLDTSMEYYLRIPLRMVTQVGFQALFGKKQSEVDLDQVDAIQYRDKNKNVRFLNVRVTGTPDDYQISLGKAKG